MRIGIDVSSLSKSITGIGRYTDKLTAELVKKPADFYLYSAGSISIEQLTQNNVIVRSNNFHGRVAKMLWGETYLPFLVRKDNLDLFWSPTHRLPHFLPERTIKVVTIHDMVWKHAGETMPAVNTWIERKLMPNAIKRADQIVADSISTAKDIEEEYQNVSDKVRIIYPGVTKLPSALSSQSLFSLGIKQPYFLFVGTLEPRKNLKRLIKAFALIARSHEEVSLVIAGGKGWGEMNIKRWINEYGLNGKVIVVGYVTNEQLATLYSNTLFLAMPSLYEGFGLPIVEAFSFGKPVLTSNISSMPEVAGEAAVLIDPLDEQSIALGLRSLLDKSKRDKLSEKAKLNANRFNWHKSSDQLWEVFQQAIEIRHSYVK